MAQSYENEEKIGMAFPLRLPGEKGPILACGYEEHIKQSLIALLLTQRGERVMRPEYGSGLNDYLFEGINTTITSLIKYEIETTVKYFEPRVELLDVRVESNAREPGVLRLELSYIINSSGAMDQVAFSINENRG